MSSKPLPSTDGEKNQVTIKFNTDAEYKIGKITYRVKSHFNECGEELKTKIVRLLKQDPDF